jgi:hypothetical protein
MCWMILAAAGALLGDRAVSANVGLNRAVCVSEAAGACSSKPSRASRSQR